jgi:DNA-binding Lrp family transcriptional regulator
MRGIQKDYYTSAVENETSRVRRKGHRALFRSAQTNINYPRKEEYYMRCMAVAKAYVLIAAEMGFESEMLEELKAIPEVKEAHHVYGVYNIILRIDTETMDHLKETISGKIGRIDKVRSTLTMIVYD